MTTHSPRRAIRSRPLALLWLGISLAALPGCRVVAPAQPVAPVASYARGDLEAGVPVDYRRGVEAAKGALSDLNLALIGETRDANKTVLVSRTPGDKRIEIDVGDSGNALISIKIRVGIFGDEQMSLKIFEQIQARLRGAKRGG